MQYKLVQTSCLVLESIRTPVLSVMHAINFHICVYMCVLVSEKINI